ncbi:MAG: hypothetical protein WAK98_14465, partial [Gemmobacter sp.]
RGFFFSALGGPTRSPTINSPCPSFDQRLDLADLEQGRRSALVDMQIAVCSRFNRHRAGIDATIAVAGSESTWLSGHFASRPIVTQVHQGADAHPLGAKHDRVCTRPDCKSWEYPGIQGTLALIRSQAALALQTDLRHLVPCGILLTRD